MKALLFIGIVLVASCSGESREERLFGPNAHVIAGDTAPWQNERIDGSELRWDQHMDARARLQNEYARIP